MRFIDIKVFLCMLLLFFVKVASAAEQQMNSPIFGFSYDYMTYKYELLDQKILKALKIKSDRYWIFSKALSDRGDKYLIVSGLLAVQKDTEPVSFGNEEPTFGEVIVIKDGVPQILGSADAAFDDLDLADEIVEKLAEDAVTRAIKVHGCDFFREKMKDANAYLPTKLSVQVQKKLSVCLVG